ncbi:hypothetical protein T484DRAFT_1787783 [Baffinella frigidus]|nr:hypothetical protein T484DRAFT_1787783 [Cryptophyta sp. CCMP2293]
MKARNVEQAGLVARAHAKGTWREFTRSRLVLLARRRPDLLDAGFHLLEAQADPETADPETVGEMRAADMERPKLTYDEQAAFKVIVVVDGNVNADRLPAQMSRGTEASATKA